MKHIKFDNGSDFRGILSIAVRERNFIKLVFIDH